MLEVFALQLPFSVCIVWCVLALLKENKNHADKLLVVIMALFALYYVCDSHRLSVSPNYNLQVILYMIGQLASLVVLPFACLYIRYLFEDSPVKPVYYLLLLPALFLCISTVILVSILGIEDCASLIRLYDAGLIVPASLDVFSRTYLSLIKNVYVVELAIYFLGSLFCFISYLFKGRFKFEHMIPFLRGSKSSFVPNILSFILIVLCVLMIVRFILGLHWLLAHPFVTTSFAVIISVLLFFVGYVTVVPSLPGGYIDKERLLHPFDAMKQSRQEYLAGINSGPVADKQVTGYDKLMDSFQELMIKEQGFLNPSMTIDEISRQLNSNRTYVSKLVNIYYGMPFRDYLNNLRIDFAKQLMLDEPDAVIDYIALKSGFQSSTQFIRKFRETEGLTPTVWRSQKRSKK